MPESQQPERGQRMITELITRIPNRNVLDMGAGEGKWGKILRGRVKKIEAIEIYEPYIKTYELGKWYDRVYHMDAREYRVLDKQRHPFDVVILGDILEHLPYADAIELVFKLKQDFHEIYLTIPINYCPQQGLENPYEDHLHHWHDKELRDLFGFTLLNIGVNDNGLVAVASYCWLRGVKASNYLELGL